jgi:hypothetical protein
VRKIFDTTSRRAGSGAPINEISATLHRASHRIRCAMSGALQKNLDLTTIWERIEGRGQVYRLA